MIIALTTTAALTILFFLFNAPVIALESQIFGADELIESGELDLVSICTPTDTHVELATRALKAGLHVLLEKPVALDSASVAALQAAAKKSGKLCMPAMCMRFWPAWAWLKARVDSGAFGAVTSAAFRRLGTRPGWNNSFYGDADRCGGALFDLHVHDADFVRWLLGEPTRVLTTGTLDHMSTFYRFENGPAHAYAEGGWDHADGYPFLMGYVVVFEDATADFVLKRTPQLRLSRGGKYEVVKTPDIDGYDGEARYFLDSVANGEKKLTATLEQAVGLTRMLEAERQSLETGDWVDAR